MEKLLNNFGGGVPPPHLTTLHSNQQTQNSDLIIKQNIQMND